MNTRQFAIAFALLSSLCFFVLRPTFSQEEDEAEAEARKTADRFLQVLERNPRRGTALDKVVEFHLDHESLDEVITRMREQAEATEFDDAGRAWLVVGLIEASQANAEAAQSALERADELLPKSAVASFTLGQNLMTLNRWEDAATALERAIQRKPAPTDLLDVFQTLGRVQQRLAPGDKVVEVWARLEKLVPDDPRVPLLIAKTLLDDGHWEAALPRFEALARATKDLYQRSEFELEAVDLRLKLGQFDVALKEADRLLGGLKQDHWLFRETRRRVEEAFLAKDDAAGLIKHYEERLVKQPEDLDAVVRLSRTLVSIDRHKDARARLEAGIKLAPTSVDLRLELIELLQSDQQFAEAIAQYEQLDRIEPNNPDHIRDWGVLVLKQTDEALGAGLPTPPKRPTEGLPEREPAANKGETNKEETSGPGQRRGQETRAERDRVAAAKRAAAIWRKLVDAKPKDASVASQVAGLMASADKSLLGDAAELLRTAVELEPETLSHREQLGEVLDSDGKKDESLAAWRSMAEVPRRNANNLAHLAEVLSRFGYRDETLTTIDTACELDRKSLELRFQQAELRRKWKQHELAMTALAEAAALADTPETFDRVVQVEVKVLSESEMLDERIEELQVELVRREGEKESESVGGKDKSESSPTLTPSHPHSLSLAAQHFRLAKYLEAADKLREATVAARKAVELAPRNGVFIQAAARMLTLDSQWLSAVELYERLLKIDRRFRIDSLHSIAELEQKLGRKEKALKAGRELLAAAPGNPENAEFVVEVCLRFGQEAEALQILRRASRQNVADKKLALKLVERLQEVGSGEGGVGSKDNKARTSVSPLPTPHSPLEESREILWRVFEQTSKSDDRIEVVRKLAELSVFPGEFTKLTQRLERYRTDPKLRRDASLALVQVHEQAGDTQQARRELERWLPQAPRDPALLARMVSLCESAGDLEAAITHQQRLADVTRKREADEHFVVLLRRAGRDTEADTLASRWLETERDPVKVLKEIDRLLTSFSTPGSARGEKQPLQLALRLTQSWRDRDPQNWEFMVREALVLVELFEPEKARLVRDDLLKLELPDDMPSVLAATRTSKVAAVERVDRMRQRFTNSELPIVDYGQARRIALDGRLLFGTYWLSHQRPGNVADRLSPPTSEGTSKLRQAWDNVYALTTKEPAAQPLLPFFDLQAAAPEDVAVDWLTLRVLSSMRQVSFAHFMESEVRLSGEPLDDVTLDRLLVSLRRLLKYDETLEWQSHFSLPELVSRELQLAGRTEDLQRLLADLEAAKPSLNSLGWLIQQAARRNDAAAATRLLRRYADEAAVNPAAVVNFTGHRYANPAFVALWVQNVMTRLGADQSANSASSKERVLKFLDDTWGPLTDARMPPHSDAVIREQIQVLISQTPSQAATPPPQNQLQRLVPTKQGWLVWTNSSSNVTRKVVFPEITKAPEVASLRVLMQAHAIASEGKWTDELREHLRRKAFKTESQSHEKFTAFWGLASLLVWDNMDKEALPVMLDLFDLAVHQPSLQLEIAEFHQRSGSQEAALDLFDRIETNDGQLRKEIEQRAVLLAVKLGRVERLRVAAERLFGMKLEPAEELQLASTLSGLGLHEHAEAIRQRLPQRAGNNLAVLQQAMQERIDAKKIDEACQIAEQIIRRTSPANTLIGSVQQSTFGGGQQARVITTTSTARTRALALLGQQGRLGPLIEQAEQQFDRSPQSLKLFGQLAELYGAEQPLPGSPNDKIAKLLVRLADSEAPDPQFRLTLARALVSAGKAQLAAPHFLFAIERLPNATAQVLFEAEQILSELGHVDELAAIVLKSKLAVNDQQRVELFSRIVQRLEGPPIRAKLIIDLFEKALREAPDFRPMLAARLLAVSESVWQQEEMWPIARDLVVPSADRKNVGAWYGIDVFRLQNDKQIDSLARRTVELAARLKKLDELAANVKAGMQTHPDWSLGANVLFGLIRIRQKHTDVANEHFRALFERRQPSSDPVLRFKENDAYPMLACLIGVELARAGDFASAAKFYESTNATELVLEHCRWFGKEPAMQQLAVRIVNRMLAGLDDPAELTRQAGSPLFVEAAKITAEINQPYVAARLAQAMITRWQLPSANNSDGGTWLEQLEHRFANSRAAIKPEMLPGILTDANRRAGGVSPPVDANSVPSKAPPTGGLTLPARLDLLAHVTGDSLTNLRLDSPFVSLLKEAAKDKDLWAKWTAELAREFERAEGRADLSLVLLASLTELNGQTSEVSALSRLVEVAKSNLKTERSRTAPAGSHPQLGLWLVARECLGREDHQKLGHELAELATESASRHFDPRFQWAILRERGELAHKVGDKELASKLWTRLAEEVLRPRSGDESVPMFFGRKFVWSGNWPNTRLQRARELCRMTLDADMSDLSLTIFRSAVNWPKSAAIQSVTKSDSEASGTLRGDLVLDAQSFVWLGTAEDILATWDALEPEWRAKGVAADAIFATLLECVLPTNRPEEVFVFAVSPNAAFGVDRALGAGLLTPPKRGTAGLPEREAATNEGETFGPGQRRGQETRAERGQEIRAERGGVGQSLALRLVELAVAEKRIDSLAQRLPEREKTVANSLPLRLIHLLLARQMNDEQRLDVEVAKLGQLDWSKGTVAQGRIATQIVALLTPLTERREAVGRLFEQWIGPLGKAFPRDEHPLADVRRWLAKRQLDEAQPDKAKETIAAHLRHMDQVWSATGAMDGQHLRRLELLAIAAEYAAAGLTRETIDLLAQVADARWPDRYPDENPGPVLATLEAALKTRPAQERYEFWRAWSLPNDGVKSMRMLTGAGDAKSEVRSSKPEGEQGSDISNFKSQISNLKSTALLLVEAAREADRLAELDAFVEEQMKQRPTDRLHVVLALIHLANKSPAAAETLVRQQLTLGEAEAGKSSGPTRTRIWDDWLLSVACSSSEPLRALGQQLGVRAEAGAKVLKDEVLLNALRSSSSNR